MMRLIPNAFLTRFRKDLEGLCKCEGEELKHASRPDGAEVRTARQRGGKPKMKCLPLSLPVVTIYQGNGD